MLLNFEFSIKKFSAVNDLLIGLVCLGWQALCLGTFPWSSYKHNKYGNIFINNYYKFNKHGI